MIPKRLQQKDFGFCLIPAKSKAPFEPQWQKKPYSYDDKRLQKHLKAGGNYGCIGGIGNLRILDIDDVKLADKLLPLLNTFTVRTGSGGLHFYFISDYNKNHVLGDGKGELRAKNYQVVGAGSTHPNGKLYTIANDAPIKDISGQELSKLIQPYFKTTNAPDKSQQATKETDQTRSGKEWREILKLIKKSKKENNGVVDKDWIFNEMNFFSKWKDASVDYKNMTFNKALSELYKTEAEQTAKKLERIDLAQVRDEIMNLNLDSFSDENGDAWVHFQDGQERRFYQVTSQEYRDFLRVSINDICNMPRESWLDPLMRYFESSARRHEKRKLSTRFAALNGDWYIQLSNSQCAKISDSSVQIIDNPLLFRTFGHQLDLKADLTVTKEDIHLLDDYLNFSNDVDKRLFKMALPVYMIPGVAKAIVLFRGPPGSAKSTSCKFFIRLLDPSSSMEEGIAFPKDQKDWFSNLIQHAVLFLDNLSHFKAEQQDDCCRIITGTIFKVRKLYTDNQTVQNKLQGALCINGINFSNLQSDFIDRSLIYELARIEDRDRKGDTELYRGFEAVKPKVLGACFRILKDARTIYPDVSVPTNLRLRDFARWCVSCGIACGYSKETILADLETKARLQQEESIEQSPIAEPLVKFMKNRNIWEGTTAQLLKELREQEYGQIVGSGESERIQVLNVPKSWPSDATRLSRELSRIGHLLRYMGIGFEKGHTGKKRYILLKNIENADFSVISVSQQTLQTTNDTNAKPKNGVS